MFRVNLIVCLFMVLYNTGRAQELSDIERLLESNDIESSEAYYEDLVATLVRLATHPVNINTAKFDSLKMLFFLSDSQIDNLLAFRRKHGNFNHPNELLLVTGIGTKDLTNIKPFIRIGNASSVETWPLHGHQEIIARLKTTRPKQAGYKKYSRDAFMYEKDYLSKKHNRFQGPPVGTLFKYKATLGNRWEGGLTLENDAGEAYFTRYQKTGFDFLSFHLCFTPDKIVKKLFVGDYKIQWGQGLTAWSGYAPGKSAASLSNEKTGNGITPYTSTDENRFLRGVAIRLQPAHGLITELFISYKKSDANLTSTPDTLLPEVMQRATLYETGYHRNESEREKKDNLKEFTTGISASLNHRYFRVGAHVLHYNFNPPLTIGDAPYQRYNDQGRHRTLTSVDYKTGLHHFYLFGETARSDNGAWATVNGLRYNGFSKLSLCALYRRYDKNYQSHYSGAFTEYSNTSNEQGFYFGVESLPFPNLKINAYYDHFRFFTPRYRASIPASGQEIMMEVTYTRPKYECTLYFKHEGKPEDNAAEKLLSSTRVKQEYRLQFTRNLSRQVELRTRATYVRYRKNEKEETGYLIYQDFVYTTSKANFKTQFRFAYFDTDSYNSRIYAYENNVLYGYSFPAYYDRGFRSYINLNWKPISRIALYLKTGIVYYPDKTYLSSSLTQVDDNKLFDIAFQIRISL